MLVSDESLRRARLQRYAEPSTAEQQLIDFRVWAAQYLGKTPDDILTKEDIDKLEASGKLNKKFVDGLRIWTGMPIKWAVVKPGDPLWNEIPNQTKIAFLMARRVGKHVSDVFTAEDLQKLADKFGWSQGAINFWKPFVGRTFMQVTDGVATGLIDSMLNIMIGIPTLPGSSFDPAGGVRGIFDAFNWLRDPQHWIALLAIVAGAGMIIFGATRIAG